MNRSDVVFLLWLGAFTALSLAGLTVGLLR